MYFIPLIIYTGGGGGGGGLGGVEVLDILLKV